MNLGQIIIKIKIAQIVFLPCHDLNKLIPWHQVSGKNLGSLALFSTAALWRRHESSRFWARIGWGLLHLYHPPVVIDSSTLLFTKVVYVGVDENLNKRYHQVEETPANITNTIFTCCYSSCKGRNLPHIHHLDVVCFWQALWYADE